MIHRITTAPAPDRNSGIVPPWLQPGGQNTGIVPPWLAGQPTSKLPVDRYVAGETQFVSQSVDASPASLADALRGR